MGGEGEEGWLDEGFVTWEADMERICVKVAVRRHTSAEINL